MTPSIILNVKFKTKRVFLLISRELYTQLNNSKINVHYLVRYSYLQHMIVHG